MYRIFEFLSNFKEYVTLAVLIIICFLLMSLGNAAELHGFRTIIVGGIGVAQNIFSWIPNPVALKSENKALRELNYNLSREVVRTRKALIEDDKLRSLLELRKKYPRSIISSEVVGKTSAQMRNYMTLNVGEKQKISKGMTVITDRGLVGFVLSSSDNYSLVQLIMNRDTRIAAKLERSRMDGIVVWEGGEFLLLKNVAKSQDVKVGDPILTSGYSVTYPADLVIGWVADVRDEPNSLFRRVAITPAVDFSTVEEVFVDTQLVDPERVELEKSLEKKLLEKKILGKKEK